jgi:RNase adaptor protein for sRNA GlmZ degradation
MNATAVRPHEHVLYRPVPGAGGVLLDLERREYFALDDVAARMWEELSDTGVTSSVVETLAAEYDVERTLLEEDVEQFMRTLVERDLVHLSEV